ncbi:hypothetical protein ACHAXT_008832 [Thalassiosira profunda]
MIHPAAAIFGDHLLSGVAEENKLLQAEIGCLSRVREFVDSRGGLNWNKYDDLPATSEQQTRLAIVEALGGDTDDQMELLGENKRLERELLVLEKIAETLGTVEISNGGGETIKLSLRGGAMRKRTGSFWVLDQDCDIPFSDVTSMECLVGGKRLPLRLVGGRGGIVIFYNCGTVLRCRMEGAVSSRRITSITLALALRMVIVRDVLIGSASMKARILEEGAVVLS